MKQFFPIAIAFLLASCVSIERNNPDDPGSSNYNVGGITPEPGIVYGSPVIYEGETYETVVIGVQTWLNRNLNYAAPGSKCGNGTYLIDANTTTCDTYGRLYNWATAMGLPDSCNSSFCASQIGTKHRGICPDGWHIPTYQEWETLRNFAGSSISAKQLKAKSGWDNNGNGSDAYGFSALPGGSYSRGSFSNVGKYGTWWTAREVMGAQANAVGMSYEREEVDLGSSGQGSFKSDFYSVRCVKYGSSSLICGSQILDESTQFCDNDIVYDLCDGKTYKPANQRCGTGDVVETKCGTDWYNAEMQFCDNNTVYDLCGGKTYKPANQRCGTFNVIETKCGSEWYDAGMQFCDGSSIKSYGKLIDSRDSKTYKTVEIGTQTWMAENLNYAANNSVYYENKENIYGRLYYWTTALSVCPDGWHLPNDAEWDLLMTAVGDSSTAGTKLKAKNGWSNNGNGTDNYGFSALPGGRGGSDGYFRDVGNYGYWWSSSEYWQNYANLRYMDYASEGVHYGIYNMNGLQNVRCVKD